MGANAQTSVPTFTAGEILTAANMNISARTGIPVFATSTTRDAAFGGTGEKTLAEGQFAYLEDSNTTQYYDGAAWQSLTVGARIGQVVSTAKTDTFTTTSTTFTDVTGLSVSITPTLATSKIFVLVMLTGQGLSGTASLQGRLMRDSTAIAIGDAAGSRARVSLGNLDASGSSQLSSPIMFLDSPATTSSTTYKVQILCNQTPNTVFVNRSSSDTDSVQLGRGISTITVMEVIV